MLLFSRTIWTHESKIEFIGRNDEILHDSYYILQNQHT